MMIELLHSPYPDGYGEDLLPLDQCKAHLAVMADDQDDLISVLRDAAIEVVEQYCSVRLLETEGLVLRADAFPIRTGALILGARPVKEITAVKWTARGGAEVDGGVASFRLATHGDLLPAFGSSWPSDVAGGLEITFTAGYPAGAAPRALLHAVKMFMAHLWAHREAVIDSGSAGEVPFGVTMLCGPYRRVLI